MNNVIHSKTQYVVFNRRICKWLQDDEGMDFYFVNDIFSARQFNSSERSVRYINQFLDYLNEYLVYYRAQPHRPDAYADEILELSEQYKDIYNLEVQQVDISASISNKPLTFEFMLDKLEINSENL